MTELYGGCTIREVTPNAGIKRVLIETAATANVSDTITLTLGSVGITTFLGLQDNLHTTENSVIIPLSNVSGNLASTTAVSSGVLTVTIGSGTAKKHAIEVIGK